MLKKKLKKMFMQWLLKNPLPILHPMILRHLTTVPKASIVFEVSSFLLNVKFNDSPTQLAYWVDQLIKTLDTDILDAVLYSLMRHEGVELKIIVNEVSELTPVARSLRLIWLEDGIPCMIDSCFNVNIWYADPVLLFTLVVNNPLTLNGISFDDWVATLTQSSTALARWYNRDTTSTARRRTEALLLRIKEPANLAAVRAIAMDNATRHDWVEELIVASTKTTPVKLKVVKGDVVH